MYEKPSQWLDIIAKRFFTRLSREHPHIRDRESLAMLCDYYSTWRTAQAEMQDYLKQSETMLLDGKLHPLMAAQRDSHAAYERLSKRLGLYGHIMTEEDAIELDLSEGEE